MARLALLFAAVAAVAGAFGLARPRHVEPYACPMHAEVRAMEPGACPVCGMALEHVKVAAGVAVPAAFAVGRPDLVVVRSRVFSRELRAPARVEADGREIAALLDADDLDPARTEEGGVFTAAGGAGAPSVPISPVDAPAVAADDATSWVRFRAATAVTPGAIGRVSWPARSRAALALPDTAIIRDADGPYVLVAAEGAPMGVEKRAVRVGKGFQGLAVVVSGLAPGERVVADGAFTWDAERRLHAAHAP